MLSHQDIQEVRRSFAILGIDPTIDRAKVVQAFRNQAKNCHPDRFLDPKEKARCHHKFIELSSARDHVLEVIVYPELMDILAGRREPEPMSDTSDGENPSGGRSGTAYDAEWTAFVKDEHAYFGLLTSTRATLLFTLHASSLGLSVGAALGLQGVLLLTFLVTLATLLVAALSSSVALPVLGWAIGIKLLISIPEWKRSLAKSIKTRFKRASEKTVRLVARTGFPSRAFWISLLAASLACILGASALFSFGHEVMGWACVLVLITMIPSMLMVYESIEKQLEEMDAAFDKIRKSSSYALIVRKS